MVGSVVGRAGAVLAVTILGISLATVSIAQENVIEVVVSPNVLNLQSNGGSVSLHTDINYNWVDGVELEVEGNFPETSIFADDRGDLVVKCEIDTIKSMVLEGTATFNLTVDTTYGIYFGTDTITVIDRGRLSR